MMFVFLIDKVSHSCIVVVLQRITLGFRNKTRPVYEPLDNENLAQSLFFIYFTPWKHYSLNA